MFNKTKKFIAAVIGRTCNSLPDTLYLKIRYRLIMGRKLDLDNPKSFNEKLNWLKVYYRNPICSKLVDKSTVKDYVSGKIGKEYIIPTYGVWDKFSEIDFNSLSNEFVLKSTNGGGGTGVIICRDKSSFDRKSAQFQLEKSMSTNYKIQREWVYYDVKPRIIAEELIKYSGNEGLADYKLLCFNGEPRLLFYVTDRYSKQENVKFDWYDMDLNHLPIKSLGYQNASIELPYFKEFDLMKELARKLSSGFPFVRVDFYCVNHKVYFGEMTFFHDGAFVPIVPYEWELEIGSWLNLPNSCEL